MPNPNTFRENVREKAEKAVRRQRVRKSLTDADLDEAAENYRTEVYQEFFKDCRDDGRETAVCGALWSMLKERGDVQTGGGTSEPAEPAQAPSSGQQAAADGGGPVGMGGGFSSVEDLEAAIDAADEVYLITQPGCPSCAAVKDALSSWIDRGAVTLLNIQQSDLGADIVAEEGLTELPALIVENDGERAAV